MATYQQITITTFRFDTRIHSNCFTNPSKRQKYVKQNPNLQFLFN